MRDKIIHALTVRFESYRQLAALLDDDNLIARPDLPKHKNMAEHLWCVVGARESYAAAIVAGDWAGFNCSMSNFTADGFGEALASSAQMALDALAGVDDWTSAREEMLLTLAEHEVMHEGQIIRHLYACDIEIPPSVRWA